MAEAENPMNQNIRRDTSSRRPMGKSPLATARPGLVTFAAVILFILGGFQAIWALVELPDAAWISRATCGTFGGHL